MAKGRNCKETKQKYLRMRLDGEKLEKAKNQKKASSEAFGWRKVGNNKETKRKYLRM
jgi:hypothetical protein